MSQTISAALADAVRKLTTTTDTAQLDAEILLCYVLSVTRSHLYAWPQKILTTDQFAAFSELITRRARGEPVAYMTGHQEFWSLDFVVTPDVLIPRPETELLVEIVLKVSEQLLSPGTFSARGEGLGMRVSEGFSIADLGTGSGAIAISIAHERPEWDVYATDQSAAALQIAQLNANNANVKNISFYQGNWCHALPSRLFDMIVTNPPYIAEHDVHLQQHSLRYEPQQALVSGVDGLDAIREIIIDATDYLKPGGVIMIEHGYNQAAVIRELLVQAKYQAVFTQCDLSGIERVTVGYCYQ